LSTSCRSTFEVMSNEHGVATQELYQLSAVSRQLSADG
jgi:hypothetical protein